MYRDLIIPESEAKVLYSFLPNRPTNCTDALIPNIIIKTIFFFGLIDKTVYFGKVFMTRSFIENASMLIVDLGGFFF